MFRLGIITEPPPKPDTAVQRELDKSAPSKKPAVDMKERRRLAKRIVKAVQPQLEAAARAEEEITQKAPRELVQEVEQLLESCLETKDFASIGDATSVSHIGEHDHDVEMADADHAHAKGALVSGMGSDVTHFDAHDSIIVDMPDVDAPGEEVDNDFSITAPRSTAGISVSALSEVDANVSLAKGTQVNDTKFDDTPPDSNGYTSQTQQGKEQHTPPTPPVSTSEANEPADALTQGGILWYLKDFSPEGTSAAEPAPTTNETTGLGAEVDTNIEKESEENEEEEASTKTTSTPAKGKKVAKSKKKTRSRR